MQAQAKTQSTSYSRPTTQNSSGFVLTPKQVEANKLLGSPAQHILLRGGSRSGKTFLLLRAMVIRALKARGSTHVILREHFNHLKHSIIFDTFPSVMAKCFEGVPYRLDRTDWFHEFRNGSRFVYGGLDDKERTEKVLGQEHSTIFLNEASQISYSARNMALTRLAQNSGLQLKEYIDCNPPSIGHWTHRLFFKKVEPTSGKALARPNSYVTMQLNPHDNLANLPATYIETLESLPEKDKIRFLRGEYMAEVENALWTYDVLDRSRCTVSQLPDLQRITINIDPSGAAGKEDKRSDEIGITATGRDRRGQGYVLEDASERLGPEGWATKAIGLYDKWSADMIVAERNFGGAMVEATIKAAAGKRNIPIKVVTASRGKVQRAEPISALYNQKDRNDQPVSRVTHVMNDDGSSSLVDLEEQLCNFSTAGYQGSKSPDRADSAIWGLTELMLGHKHYGMLEVV